ncbi:hypothetical protein OJJOAM_002377 [Cupriavidus sp. H18C1]
MLLAQGADQAIEMLRNDSGRTAVLVTDFRMPGRNGADLLRQVAAEYPQIVRILVTAYADKDMLLQTVNSGEVFRILEKPLGLQAVRDVLALARERHRERQSRHQRLTAIDETLAFLAHELNTPLAAIANFARGVESRSSAEYDPQRQAEIGQAAAVMHSNAQYCLAVISSFLQSVRGNGERPLTSENDRDITAGSLIMALLDSYPFTGPQRNWIEVELHGDFIVHTLPNCVSLVLSSLLNNGLRALTDVPPAFAALPCRGAARPRDLHQRQRPRHSAGRDGTPAGRSGHHACRRRWKWPRHDFLQPRHAVVRRRHPDRVDPGRRHHRDAGIPSDEESNAQQ